MKRKFIPNPKYLAILFALSLLWVSTVGAQSPLIDGFESANAAYESGQFAEAAAMYETLHTAGLSHVALYYNLGNAYVQTGDIGRAILNYRRAQQFEPRDTAINANLSLAQQQTIDKIINTPQGLITGLAYLSEETLTLPELQLIALLGWFFLMGWALIGVLWPRRFRNRLTRIVGWGGMVILTLPLLMLLGSIGSRLYLQQQYPPVVVLSEVVDVTTGPGTSERYPVSFRLHAGSEARLRGEQAGWREIILSNSLQGWVPQESIATVFVE